MLHGIKFARSAIKVEADDLSRHYHINLCSPSRLSISWSCLFPYSRVGRSSVFLGHTIALHSWNSGNCNSPSNLCYPLTSWECHWPGWSLVGISDAYLTFRTRKLLALYWGLTSERTHNRPPGSWCPDCSPVQDLWIKRTVDFWQGLQSIPRHTCI